MGMMAQASAGTQSARLMSARMALSTCSLAAMCSCRFTTRYSIETPMKTSLMEEWASHRPSILHQRSSPAGQSLEAILMKSICVREEVLTSQCVIVMIQHLEKFDSSVLMPASVRSNSVYDETLYRSL